MFSANPSISPTGLKPSNVANEVGQGERGRTWRGTRLDCGEQGRTGGNGVELGGNGVELVENGVGLEGTGSDWEGTGSDWEGTRSN